MSSRRLRSLGAALAAVALLGASAAEAACARASELSGLRTRMLQTELMVAALSCGERDRYNAFVNRFRGELAGESKGLQAYFARVHGGRASKELNAFVTELANNSSQRSIAEVADFCPQAAALFEDVLELTPRQLRAFAARQDFADAHGVDSCEGVRQARAAPPPDAAALRVEVKLPAEKPVRHR